MSTVSSNSITSSLVISKSLLFSTMSLSILNCSSLFAFHFSELNFVSEQPNKKSNKANIPNAFFTRRFVVENVDFTVFNFVIICWLLVDLTLLTAKAVAGLIARHFQASTNVVESSEITYPTEPAIATR